MPEVPPAPPGRGTPRRWPWLVAAAVTGAAVAAAAVVLPGGGGAGGGTSPGHQGSRTSDGPRVVTAHGSADRSGEFGSASTRASVRPDGWKPWSVDRPAALDDRGRGCVLVLPRLICRDGKGAAAAFDAASGRAGWTSRGFTAGPDDLQGIQELPPESDGTRVFVPSELGVTGVDAATGTVRWRHRLPRYTGLLALTYAKGVLYTAEFTMTPGTRMSRSTVVRARRASDGHELWRTAPLPKPQGPLLTGDGRVYLAAEGGGVLALSTKDGSRTASAPTATCFALLRHASSVLCWDLEHPGVRELDGRTLALRRTVAADVRPTLPGPVVGADGVLVVAVRQRGRVGPRRPLPHGVRLAHGGACGTTARPRRPPASPWRANGCCPSARTPSKGGTPRVTSTRFAGRTPRAPGRGPGRRPCTWANPFIWGACCSPTPTRARSSPATPRDPIRSPPTRAYRRQPRDTGALATPCAVVAGARWPYRRR